MSASAGPRWIRWRRVVGTAALGLALAGTLHLTAAIVDGLGDAGGVADVAVVLGNHVNEDGTPSRRLALRLDRALALYQAGEVPTIIVSGGQTPGHPHEAGVMKRYLVERGVPAAAVVEDRGGVNTFQTARFVAGYVREHELGSVVAVTHYYHLSRTKLALRRFGVPGVIGAHAAVELEAREPWSLLREVVGYYVYLVRPLEG